MTASKGDPTPEQLTRNLGELLQELRVVQTGVQILTGFLLTVPFSARFEDLTGFQRTTFLVVLCGSVLTTAFVVAPVAFHRVLFRRHERHWIVEAADVTSRIGLGLLALTSAGVLLLVSTWSWGARPASSSSRSRWPASRCCGWWSRAERGPEDPGQRPRPQAPGNGARICRARADASQEGAAGESLLRVIAPTAERRTTNSVAPALPPAVGVNLCS